MLMEYRYSISKGKGDFMLSKEDMKKILDVALEGGGDFAEVFVEKRKGEEFTIEDRALKTLKSEETHGVGIRVISGDYVGYSVSEDLRMESLLPVAKQAGRIAGNGGGVLSIGIGPVVYQRAESSLDVPDREKVELIRRAEASALGHEKITQAWVSYKDFSREFVVINSEGVYATSEEVYSRLVVEVLGEDGGIRHPGRSARGGYCGIEMYSGDVPERVGQEAAKMAQIMLGAKPAPAGEMPVILGDSDGSVFLHEAIGHSLEADHIQKNNSIFAGKQGKRVAPDIVTIIDDPTIPGQGGSIKMDDEGTVARRTVLVENGILVNFMYDRFTARRAGAELTGNGRRQSYQYYPIPRMTNTCLLGGDSSFEEIIQQVKRGFYAKRFGGGQVSPASGDFTFAVMEGYYIENGEIAYPVRGASLIGNSVRVMQDILMVGNDFSFWPGGGMCGKMQTVPVSGAQPTILVKSMTVGGTEI